MNQLTYPITQHLSSDVITDQFQNVNISTSYFLNMFKECNPSSIQHALTNNTFVDDLIDLIASIKIDPLELDNTTLNMSTNLSNSITNYKSKISNKSTTSVDVSLYLEQITHYVKLVDLYNKYKHLAQSYIIPNQWNDMLGNTLKAFIDPNPQAFIHNGHIMNQYQVENDCLDTIYTYILTINNNTIFTPDELNKINNIYKNTFNDTKLIATEFTKLYILLKYAFYLDNKENCETILEITNSTINRYAYILNINDQPLIYIIDRFTSIMNQNGYNNQFITQLFANFNTSKPTLVANAGNTANPAHINPNPANLGIDDDWNILLTTVNVSINLFFIDEIVNTTAMCIYNIYLLLENVYKCIPLFNIIVQLINRRMISANMLYFLITLHQLIGNVYNQHVIQPSSILGYIRSFIDYRYSSYIPHTDNKLYDINNLCMLFFNISYDDDFRDSLIRASLYIVSEYFPIDIGNLLRMEIAQLDQQQLDLLKNRIKLNKNLLKTTYVNDLLLYIEKQTNDRLDNCFASLTSSDVRSDQFIDLYSLIYFKNEDLAEILLESPSVPPVKPPAPNAVPVAPPAPIIPTNPIKLGTDHIPVSSPIATGLVDIATRTLGLLPPGVSMHPSFPIAMNYMSPIYEDMKEMHYMYYDIDAEYLPQTYNENLFPKYKYLINKHHRPDTTSINSVENMFNFKYATAYSRIFLMNELSNQTYNIYTFDKQLNCFKSIEMKYIVDSRLKHVMHVITEMSKFELLNSLCDKSDQYLASDKDEKILFINNIIKEL